MKKNSSGQSFFEVVFAVGIASLVLVTLVALSAVAIKNATYSKEKAQATQLSEQALEWLKSQKEADWDSIANSTGTWCLTDLAWDNSGSCGGSETVEGTEITREVTLQQEEDDLILATIKMTWNDGSATRELESSTYLARWKAAGYEGPDVGITPPPSSAPTPTPGSRDFIAVDDSYVNKNSKNKNFGSDGDILVGKSPIRDAYFKFDLGDLENATIYGAQLEVTVRGTSAGESSAWQKYVVVNDTSWNEDTITWNNKPDLGGQIVRIKGGDQDETIQINVTSLVRSNKGGYLSIGVTNDDSRDDRIEYYSKEVSGSSRKPKIHVDYTL